MSMRLLVLGFVALVGLLTACGGGKDMVKIGVLTPTTGTAASVGIDELNGAQLYFEEVEFEIAGREIQLIPEDAACNPEIGLPKMRKLIERDEVHAVIGPVCSSVASRSET